MQGGRGGTDAERTFLIKGPKGVLIWFYVVLGVFHQNFVAMFYIFGFLAEFARGRVLERLGFRVSVGVSLCCFNKRCKSLDTSTLSLWQAQYGSFRK